MTKIKLFFRRVVTLVVVVLMFVAVSSLYGFVTPAERIVRERFEVQVEKPKPSLKELIETIPPKYGIPSLVAAIVVAKESSGRLNSIKFEPGQMDKARKEAPRGTSQEDLRQYSSSHCYLQVMGWHTPKLGLTWADLYDPVTCFEVGMKTLKDCKDKQHAKSKAAQWHGAFQCYQGGEAYADELTAKLGEVAIERML